MFFQFKLWSSTRQPFLEVVQQPFLTQPHFLLKPKTNYANALKPLQRTSNTQSITLKPINFDAK